MINLEVESYKIERFDLKNLEKFDLLVIWDGLVCLGRSPGKEDIQERAKELLAKLKPFFKG